VLGSQFDLISVFFRANEITKAVRAGFSKKFLAEQNADNYDCISKNQHVTSQFPIGALLSSASRIDHG
jgi:hypothetical protein